MEFKDRLKELRTERKLKQKEVAEQLNYGYTAISNYEKGRNEPSIKDLKKIAEFFNVSLDYLLCVTQVRSPYLKDKDYKDLSAFYNKFFMLNNESREELYSFMDWLLDKQDKDSRIKVAQDNSKYKTRLDLSSSNQDKSNGIK